MWTEYQHSTIYDVQKVKHGTSTYVKKKHRIRVKKAPSNSDTSSEYTTSSSKSLSSVHLEVTEEEERDDTISLLTRFCEQTTIHGFKEFVELDNHIAQGVWGVVFLAIISIVCWQVYTVTENYYNEPTTTDFELGQIEAHQYTTMPVCVPIDRMVSSAALQYNLTERAKWYLAQQWFSWMLDSDGLDYAIDTEDYYSDVNMQYFPNPEMPDNSLTWNEMKQFLEQGMADGEQAIRDLVESHPERYSMSVQDMFDISSQKNFLEGSFLPIAIQTRMANGPYTSVGQPNFVCWDIEPETVDYDYDSATINWLVRIWADQDVDGALWIFYFTHFYGQNDVFATSRYQPVEYPDREFSTKQMIVKYNLQVDLLRRKRRRDYSCQATPTGLRYSDNTHEQQCLDRCLRRYIGSRYNCTFDSTGASLFDFCHQYHIQKKLLDVQEWLSFFTDATIRSSAEKVYNNEPLTPDEAFGHSHTDSRPQLMMGLMFRQIITDAKAECHGECKDYSPFCDVYKFYAQNTVLTFTAYEDGERGPPAYNETDHGSEVDFYDVKIRVSVLPARSEYQQVIISDFGDYISNLGGLSGFYLGVSVFSVIQLIMICCLQPLGRLLRRLAGNGDRNADAQY